MAPLDSRRFSKKANTHSKTRFFDLKSKNSVFTSKIRRRFSAENEGGRKTKQRLYNACNAGKRRRGRRELDHDALEIVGDIWKDIDAGGQLYVPLRGKFSVYS